MTQDSTTRQNPFKPIYQRANAGDSWQKFKELEAFPNYVDIELTNLCNFRCLMCPTGNFSQKRAKGFLDIEIYRKVISELADHGTPIRFIRWGEPFMHPNFIEMLRIAKSAGLLMHVNTNGSYLTDALIEELVEIPLDSIKFSFQGVDRKSYNEMRNTDFFDELITVMRQFKELRGDRLFPYMHLSTSITYESDDEVKSFKNMISEIVDSVTIGRTVLDFIDIETVRLRPHEVEMLRTLKAQESVVKAHPECPEVYDKLSINWDGTVTACCGDSDNLMLVGDINKQSLAEVWKSDQLNEYRRILADMRHDELDLCKNCYSYQDPKIQHLENL